MKIRHSFVVFFALLLASCDGQDRTQAQDTLTEISPGLWAHSTVKESERALIKADIGRLKDIEIPANSALGEVTGIGDVSSASLAAWLSARVKYIVGQNYNDQNIYEFKRNSPYSPVAYGDAVIAPHIVIVMFNLGSSVYSLGKANDTVYQANLDGREVVINSPRVGLLRIGAGLFSSSVYAVKDHASDSMGVSLNRLSVYFHEARHSDGNQSNLGFPHAVCPEGSPYKGLPQCDQMSNGAFAVESRVLDAFIQACQNCDAAELEAMKLNLLDAESRLIGGQEKIPDARPERTGG